MRIRRITEFPGWNARDGVVLENPAFGQLVHVAVCKDNGDRAYDQFLHVEGIGAVTVPVNAAGELGVVDVWRPTIPSAAEYRYPDLDLSRLGVMSTEFPRGFPTKGEAAAATAQREAEEELGVVVRDVVQIGELTPNTTFHPHRIPVFRAIYDAQAAADIAAKRRPAPPDVNEKLMNVRWVTVDALFALIRERKLHCGMTQAALACYLASTAKVEHR